ncbi:DnaJ family domain-containing protein [Nonomuraea sp. NPDC001684]
MTDRKPVGMPFESWIDRQIREAAERGEFDDLPGAGKPLPGLDRRHDEMWWIKQKLESEGLSMPLPPTLALRKEAEEALRQARGARSETEVRQILEEVNEKIREAIRKGLPGPPLNLMPFDVDRVVSEWRENR